MDDVFLVTRRRREVWPVIAVLLALTGCATPSTVAVSVQGEVLPQVPVMDLPSAATSAQREVVDRYVTTGMLPFEDYKQARLNEFACLEAAGFTVAWTQQDVRGFPMILASYGVPSRYVTAEGTLPEAESIVQDCYESHALGVSIIYESAHNEIAIDAIGAAYVTPLRLCLREQGVSENVFADAEVRELITIAGDTSAQGNVNCLESTGFAAEFEDPRPPAPPPAP